MKNTIFFSSLIFSLSFSFVFAEISIKNIPVIQSFKQTISIPKVEILAPTIVDIPVPDSLYGSYVAVYNQTQDVFEPYVFNQNSALKTGYSLVTPKSISTSNSLQGINIFDNNFQTYTHFDVTEDGLGYAEIQYIFEDNIRSTSAQLSLEQFVSFPNFITIKAIEGGQEKIILSKVKPKSGVINFPETVSKVWKIEIVYSQPLRINEFQIINSASKKIPTSIRFLAQPGKEYKIFTNSDSIVPQKTGVVPNLYTGIGKVIPNIGVEENSLYELADLDKDTVPDIYDNCVMISNIDQKDTNQNNRGDMCDDFDKDKILNSQDNCTNDPNTDQKDSDNDDVGDVCDNEKNGIIEKHPWIVWGTFVLLGFISIFLFVSFSNKNT